MTDLTQAENYIARLCLLDENSANWWTRCSAAPMQGLIPPQFTIDWALYGLRGQTSSVAVDHPFYSAFREKLNHLEGLSTEEQENLLAEAKWRSRPL